MKDNATAERACATAGKTPLAIERAGRLRPLALDENEAVDSLYSHCLPDNIVAFGSRRPSARRPDPFPHFLCPVCVKHLHNQLPGLRAHELETKQTQYWTPNTLGPSALRKGSIETYYEQFAKGRPLYFACTNDNVTELGALFLDLDVGRDDRPTPGAAMGSVFDLCLAERLPWPSLFGLSGRGVYLFWMLQGEGSPRPPIANQANSHLWSLCESALVKRCADLYADANATRMCNWLKRAGTVDTKTGNRVVYYSLGPGVQRYRLPDVAKLLDVHSVALVEPTVATSPAKPLGKGGGHPKAAAPWLCRSTELERLADHRGGIRKGFRHHALWAFFQARQKYHYMTLADDDNRRRTARAVKMAQDETRRFNSQRCRPPQSPGDLKAAMTPGKKQRVARGTTIARSLAVTDDEVAAERLVAIVPEHIRAARQDQVKSQKGRNAERRDLVDRAIAKGLTTPAIIASAEAQGFQVNRQFVHTRRAKFQSLDGQLSLI